MEILCEIKLYCESICMAFSRDSAPMPQTFHDSGFSGGMRVLAWFGEV